MLIVSFSPFAILLTKRLMLRAITTHDASQILRLRSDADTMKFLDKAPLQSLAEATLHIKKITDDVNNNDGITWGIALQQTPNILIGTIGFWHLTKEHYRAEIGYMLLPEYFKKGYMTEALAEVISYGFNKMNLHSIEANINPSNKASEQLLKSAGFSKEAYFKENYYFNGNFLDSAIYSLVNNANSL